MFLEPPKMDPGVVGTKSYLMNIACSSASGKLLSTGINMECSSISWDLFQNGASYLML